MGALNFVDWLYFLIRLKIGHITSWTLSGRFLGYRVYAGSASGMSKRRTFMEIFGGYWHC